jgi:hypothetical protein
MIFALSGFGAHWRTEGGMADGASDATESVGRNPPYVAFPSLLTLFEELKTNSTPPRIDKSVLKRFSGTVGAHLLMALKFLRLTDEAGVVQPVLKELADAYQTDDFKGKFRPVIESSYEWLNKLDLKTATPSMFADAFKNHVSAKEEIQAKCRRFYLNAAKYVGIEIGPRLLAHGSMPKSNGGSIKKRGRPSVPRADSQQPKPPATPTEEQIQDSTTSLASRLIDKFPAFNPEWPDEIKAQWFKGFGEFMAMAKK